MQRSASSKPSALWLPIKKAFESRPATKMKKAAMRMRRGL
jgi:hypothetical protein